jgi:hypothetical protein
MTALGTFASAHLQPQRTLSRATAVATVFMTALPLTAQEAGAPYCADLEQAAALAMSKERFTSIAGRSGDGNFVESKLVLTGWNDCSLYGAATYTCDSRPVATAQEAEEAQASILREVQACLGEAWTEAKDRSSAGYVVLHHAQRPVSITLSTDQTEKAQHVVRLMIFVRRSQVPG